MLPTEQLALLLLGVVWAGVSAIFVGVKHVNDVRDRIIVGKLDDESLSASHLQILFWSDWFPLKLMMSGMSLVVGLLILFLPTLQKQPSSLFSALCYGTSTIPILGSLFHLVTICVEGHHLRSVIERTKQKENASLSQNVELTLPD